jgi:hypothetical protein
MVRILISSTRMVTSSDSTVMVSTCWAQRLLATLRKKLAKPRLDLHLPDPLQTPQTARRRLGELSCTGRRATNFDALSWAAPTFAKADRRADHAV